MAAKIHAEPRRRLLSPYFLIWWSWRLRCLWYLSEITDTLVKHFRLGYLLPLRGSKRTVHRINFHSFFFVGQIYQCFLDWCVIVKYFVHFSNIYRLIFYYLLVLCILFLQIHLLRIQLLNQLLKVVGQCPYLAYTMILLLFLLHHTFNLLLHMIRRL